MEEININDLFKYFIKHIKLIILILLTVVVIGGFYSLVLKVPVYQSSTTIAFSSDKTVTSADVTTVKNMAATYTEIIKSDLVINEAIDGTAYDSVSVRQALSVSASSDSGIIKITVTTTDPESSEELANLITSSFVTVASDKYKADNVFTINDAKASSSPSNINPLKDFLIYIVIGLVLGLGTVFILFYFDKKVHNNEEVENRLKVAVIGNVRSSSRVRGTGKGELVLKNYPQSGVSEDFRTLRANVEFGFDNKNSHVILITSSIKGEGKSFISSNLSYALATNEKKTLIIDCDLRMGRLHNIFKLDNLNGLSDLILNRDIQNLDNYIHEVEDQELYVITRGVIPLNPSELLSSKNFTDVLTHLKRYFDYIILDGVPIQSLSDSLAISKHADKTLLVASVNYTPIDVLENSKKSLENVDAKLAGVILNKVQVTESVYYYHE